MKFTPHHNEKGELICLVSHKRNKLYGWGLGGSYVLLLFSTALWRHSQLASILLGVLFLVSELIFALLMVNECRCPLCTQTIRGIFHYGSIESTQHCPHCHATLEFID